MKNYLLAATLLFLSITAKSQDPLFLQGDKHINIGVGYRHYPVIQVSADFGLVDEVFDYGTLGVSPYFGLGVSSTHSHISLGCLATLHYPLFYNLDSYAGVGIGVRHKNSSFYQNKTGITPAIILGGNYPISKNFDAFAEIGTGEAYFRMGVCIKLL